MYRSVVVFPRIVVPAALGLVLAALLALAPAAGARPMPPLDLGGTAAQSTTARVGDTPADFPGSAQPVARVGDTPADFPGSAQPVARVGDTPADFPGASRAQEAPPTFVTIERPQVVADDADEALPIVLSGLALLVALGGTAYMVARRPRMGVRPSH